MSKPQNKKKKRQINHSNVLPLHFSIMTTSSTSSGFVVSTLKFDGLVGPKKLGNWKPFTARKTKPIPVTNFQKPTMTKGRVKIGQPL